MFIRHILALPKTASLRCDVLSPQSPQLQRDNKPHFVTFVTKRRWVMNAIAREITLQCCTRGIGEQYDLYVAVVMPDHVHLVLVQQLALGGSASRRFQKSMKNIKGRAAHEINRRLERCGAVWQEESFDRVLRCSEKLDEKIAYVLDNPVRRGLVKDWREYAWIWYQEKPNPYAPRIT